MNHQHFISETGIKAFLSHVHMCYFCIQFAQRRRAVPLWGIFQTLSLFLERQKQQLITFGSTGRLWPYAWATTGISRATVNESESETDGLVSRGTPPSVCDINSLFRPRRVAVCSWEPCVPSAFRAPLQGSVMSAAVPNARLEWLNSGDRDRKERERIQR